jgi:uncharacterized protein YjiS (DUF1127 family)
MATTYATTAAPFGAITTFRAIHAVETAISSLKTWNANRKTFKMLNALSSYELDDIGLARGDLKSLNVGVFH